jgi:hypothetical protein
MLSGYGNVALLADASDIVDFVIAWRLVLQCRYRRSVQREEDLRMAMLALSLGFIGLVLTAMIAACRP